MKAIMISDHAKWCALMMNGEKTIEVRKENVGKAVQKLIDEQGFADIYVYCTKNKDLMFYNGSQYMIAYGTIKEKRNHKYNGKVIFKFRCYRVGEHSWQEIAKTKSACLTDDKSRDYSKGVASLYCIHISDLEIFDKPKELSEFKTPKKLIGYGMTCNYYSVKPLTKAPQSWCYVGVE